MIYIEIKKGYKRLEKLYKKDFLFEDMLDLAIEPSQ